eukprot:49406_1
MAKLVMQIPYMMGTKGKLTQMYGPKPYFDSYVPITITVTIQHDADGRVEFDRLCEEIKKEHKLIDEKLGSNLPFNWNWDHFDIGRLLKTTYNSGVRAMYGPNKKLHKSSWIVKVTGPFVSNIHMGIRDVVTCIGCCDLCKMFGLLCNPAYVGAKNLKELKELEEQKNNNNKNKTTNKNKKRGKKKKKEESQKE